MLKLDLRLIVKKLDKKLSEIIKEDLPLLKKVKEHVIDSGGKRIRPLTHYFFTVLLGYKGQKWLEVGSIGELIHAASLLHDDVVDNAEVRRGQPTIGKLHGNKTAILSGDYLLACGIYELNKLKNPELMDSYTTVIRDLAVGELIQMEWEKKSDITLSVYEKIIYGKTASLFGAVCETAGILSGISKKDTQALHSFGIDMGKMFQIKDDYIDYFNREEKSGKQPMKDFLNGLFTYPLILLKSKITPAESKEIDRIMGKDVRDNNDIHLVSGLMDKYIIKKAILDGLKKTANSLNKFLSNFKQSPHRKLMMERIEMIVED